MNNFVELLPFLNLTAVTGLIAITTIVLFQKKKIEEHQLELNNRLDIIIQILAHLPTKEYNAILAENIAQKAKKG